jgi:hypothetical protein
MSQITDEQCPWKSVYELGGWASLVFILYSLVTMVLLIVIGGQPETAAQAFEMLQENRLIALLRLDILTLFVLPFYYVILLDIYVALRRTNLGYASLATLISCAGVTLVLATPSVFSWLSLKTSLQPRQPTFNGTNSWGRERRSSPLTCGMDREQLSAPCLC